MAQHIQKFNIDSFRGISKLSLDNLSDVNILVGDNNSGKTSVLESLLLLSNPSDFANVVNVSRMRDRYKAIIRFTPSLYDSFIYMFNRGLKEMKISVNGEIFHRQLELEISGTIEKILIDIDELINTSSYMRDRVKEGYIVDGEEIEGFIGKLSYYVESDQHTLFEVLPELKPIISKPINYHKYTRRIETYKQKPYINMTYISTIEHIIDNTFRNITRETQITNEVIELLQIFDEDIINLKIIEDDERRFVQIVEHRLLGNMPLSVYGDGIKKIIALANGIIGSKNGVLLIDEIETSIHKSAMKKVFSWLVEACKKFQVQLFLTTHSIEAVDDILNSNPVILEEDMARIITLVKKPNQTVARILSGEKAIQVRDDYAMELRE